jgi:hypothetical protein
VKTHRGRVVSDTTQAPQAFAAAKQHASSNKQSDNTQTDLTVPATEIERRSNSLAVLIYGSRRIRPLSAACESQKCPSLLRITVLKMQ